MPDLVFVPSIDVDSRFTCHVQGVEVYEQRLLCILLRLQDPLERVFYFTSQKVSEASVNYLLDIVQNLIRFKSSTVLNKEKETEERRKIEERLFMLSCDKDTSNRSLAEKLLDNDALLNMVNKEIKDVKSAAFDCYMHTELEDRVADKIGVQYDPMPAHCDFWGSKVGSRQCFQNESIPHPVGSHESLISVKDMVKELAWFQSTHPSVKDVIVKLNVGVSGLGNAVLHMPEEQLESHQALEKYLLANLRPCSGESAESFLSKLPDIGGIVEEMQVHRGITSPSVQGIIDPDNGSIRIISSHEQLLDHQIFKGCAFPAYEDYRSQLIEYGKRVGEFLAKKGAKGFYGVDFVAWRSDEDGALCVQAIEINLRHLGTTHPLLALELLTGLVMDERSGSFPHPEGFELFYVASDSFSHPNLVGLSSEDFVDAVRKFPRNLQFNVRTCEGPFFFMIDCMAVHGKLGLMYIAHSADEARQGFEQTMAFLSTLSTQD